MYYLSAEFRELPRSTIRKSLGKIRFLFEVNKVEVGDD